MFKLFVFFILSSVFVIAQDSSEETNKSETINKPKMINALDDPRKDIEKMREDLINKIKEQSKKSN